MDNVKELLNNLNIVPNDISIFEMALTHPSCNGASGTKHKDYERLEFLGDSLVGFVAAALCYKHHPTMKEGELTSIKSRFVSSSGEAAYCQKLGIDKYIRISPAVSSTINRQSLCENVFEAFVGALYLDQGRDFAISFVEIIMENDIKCAKPAETYNPKSKLQEAFQADYKTAVTYKILDERVSGDSSHFVAGVFFEGREIGRGSGSSKKEAETNAAADALSKLAFPEGK